MAVFLQRADPPPATGEPQENHGFASASANKLAVEVRKSVNQVMVPEQYRAALGPAVREF